MAHSIDIPSVAIFGKEMVAKYCAYLHLETKLKLNLKSVTEWPTKLTFVILVASTFALNVQLKKHMTKISINLQILMIVSKFMSL